MRRLLVGTAGHVDHGKTRLVQALTGVDCDRWAEEKERGITIDLGFAHFISPTPDAPARVSFIDVPGHERFLHNALAGLGGLDAALLVVAADEGIKPQTREHLAILGQLGVERLFVALTKIDIAPADLADLAQFEVAEWLATSPWPAAPIVRLSSTTGEGVETLRALLAAAASADSRLAARARPLRLPIDRAFHLKGRGLVVTGTLVGGRVTAGDALELLPAGVPTRVRALHVHGVEVGAATAGERTALQLAGLELAQVARGMTLTAPGALGSSRSLCVRFELLPGAARAIEGWTPIRLHLFSDAVVGRLRPLPGTRQEPGTSGYAELRLAAEAVACRGDRFVVRSPTPAATLGGGQVLDPAWRRPRRPALAATLAAIGEDDEQAAVAWVEAAGPLGAGPADLAPRFGADQATVRARLEALVSAGRLLALGPSRFVAPAVVRERVAAAVRILSARQREDRFASGLTQGEFITRLLGPRGQEVSDVYLTWLEGRGVLKREGTRLGAPGAQDLGSDDSRLAASILERYAAAGLDAPSPGEVARALNAKPAIVEGLVGALVRRGDLVRLPGGLILGAGAFARLRQDLVATGWTRFGVPRFKERFGLSRKWAIPLLEQLDNDGATRRVGDERLVIPVAIADPKP